MTHTIPVPEPKSVPILLGLGNVLHHLLTSNRNSNIAANQLKELPPQNLLLQRNHHQVQAQQLLLHPRPNSGGGLAALLRKVLGINNHRNSVILPLQQQKKFKLFSSLNSRTLVGQRTKSNVKLSLTLFGDSNKKVGILNKINNHKPKLLFGDSSNKFKSKLNIFDKIRRKNLKKKLQHIKNHNRRKELLKNEKIQHQKRIEKRKKFKKQTKSIHRRKANFQAKTIVKPNIENRKSVTPTNLTPSKQGKKNIGNANISKTITNTTAMISELKFGLEKLLTNVENGNGPMPIKYLSNEHIPSHITLHFKDPLGEQNTLVNLVIHVVPHYEQVPATGVNPQITTKV